MVKKVLFSFFGLTVTTLSFCQGLINNGATIVMENAPFVVIDGGVNGDFTNQDDGANRGRITVSSGGTIELEGDWTNNSADPTFNVFTSTASGNVLFEGGNAQAVGGSSSTDFPSFTVVNTSSGAGNGVTLNEPTNVYQALTLTDGLVHTDATNLMIVQNGGSTSGASEASFIDGPMRKVGTDAFTFPVGKNDTAFAPIGISAPSSATDHFTAEYTQTDPHPLYDRGLKDPTIDHVSGCEYWDLDRTNGSSNVSVTLSWDDRSCGVTNLSDLIVAGWNGALWKDRGSDGLPTGNTMSGTVTSAAAVSVFGPFTLASITAQNPLPIDLLEFTATLENVRVRLDWVTLTEINNDYFTIERSRDAINFFPIGTVPGAGPGVHTNILNYVDYDHSPFDGVNYYRLKQTDINGDSSYSDVRAVVLEAGIQIINIFPNPTSGNFTYALVSHEDADVNVHVVNVLGQQVYEMNEHVEKGSYNSYNVDLSRMASGTYLLQIETTSGLYKASKQFVVK